MSSIKRSIVKAVERTATGQVLLMGRGYLRDSGWVRSAVTQSAVDADGSPRPWMSLPAVRFLEERLPPDSRVFEWGSGNSTAWWAARAAEVVSCEHDPVWFKRVEAGLPMNAEVRLIKRGSLYENAAANGAPWDVIVVDGRDRVACALRAVDSMGEAGVLVWDDSNRERYRPGLEALASKGLSRVDFIGPKLCSRHEHATSLLYRPGRNVLNL
jgi:hypothetical protein